MWALAVELSHSRPEWLAKTYGCFTADFTLYTKVQRNCSDIHADSTPTLSQSSSRGKLNFLFLFLFFFTINEN